LTKDIKKMLEEIQKIQDEMPILFKALAEDKWT